MKRGLKRSCNASGSRPLRACRREHPDEEGTETKQQAFVLVEVAIAAESTPMKRGLKPSSGSTHSPAFPAAAESTPMKRGLKLTSPSAIGTQTSGAAESTPMKRGLKP